VVRWSPLVEGALRRGLVATPAFGGDCFTGSFAVHNAYRCIDGNFLRDPCFADSTRDDVVLCVRDPFSRGVVRLPSATTWGQARELRLLGPADHPVGEPDPPQRHMEDPALALLHAGPERVAAIRTAYIGRG
jgi:hypothetical protein